MAKETAYKKHQCYIPINFDFDSLVEQFPPELPETLALATFKKNKDVVHYIINLITELSFIYARDDSSDHFIPISSPILEKSYGIRHSNAYLRWLLLAEVFERKDYYEVKKQSFKYRLTDKYIETDFHYVEITKVGLNKKILLARNSHTKSENQKLPSVTKSSSESIAGSCNFNRKNRQLDSFFDGVIVQKELAYKEIDAKIGKLISDRHPNSYRLRAIYRRSIENLTLDHTVKDFFDANTGRYYSPLTNISSQLRNFVSHRSGELISIDIKNCQPLILSAILKPNFWRDNQDESIDLYSLPKEYIRVLSKLSLGADLELENKQLAYQNLKGKPIPFPDFSKIRKQYERRNKSLLRKTRNYNLDQRIKLLDKESASMQKSLDTKWKVIKKLAKVQSSVENKKMYLNNVMEDIYLSMEEVMKHEVPEINWSRSKVKAGMMFTLFSKNTDTKMNLEYGEVSDPKRESHYLVKKYFKQHYSSVNVIFNTIKKKDHTLLARLAQSIESTLVYDRIVTRIQRELKNVHVTTIHDSIVAPVRFKRQIADIMEQEINLALKTNITVDPDDEPSWNPDNFKYDKFLKLKSEKYILSYLYD